MTVDVLVFNALKDLAGGRVYPDEAPPNVTAPYIIFQGVGGESINFVESTVSGKRNVRMQIAVWGKTREEVSQISEQAEERVITVLKSPSIGAAMWDNDPQTRLRGALQDFSIWY